MKIFKITLEKENKIIRLGIIVFWFLFWALNAVDKFLAGNVSFWVGQDRSTQFAEYFDSIGFASRSVVTGALVGVTILEIAAFLFGTLALVYYFTSSREKTRAAVFWMILTSLVIFSLFSIADQVFGEREELLEHSIYWISFIISWFVYTHTDKRAV